MGFIPRLNDPAPQCRRLAASVQIKGIQILMSFRFGSSNIYRQKFLSGGALEQEVVKMLEQHEPKHAARFYRGAPSPLTLSPTAQQSCPCNCTTELPETRNVERKS